MKFLMNKSYVVGAVNTELDIVEDFKYYTCSSCTPHKIYLVNTKARFDKWPISLVFGRNLFRMRPKNLYLYRKFLLFENEAEVDDYNKKSFIHKQGQLIPIHN